MVRGTYGRQELAEQPLHRFMALGVATVDGAEMAIRRAQREDGSHVEPVDGGQHFHDR